MEPGNNDFLKRLENLMKLKDVTDENERLREYIQGMEDEQNPPDADDEQKPPD